MGKTAKFSKFLINVLLFQVVFVCLAGLWLWEYGFVSSPASYTLMGTTIFLLALNAGLGWRAKTNLKKVRDLQYAEYVVSFSQAIFEMIWENKFSWTFF